MKISPNKNNLQIIELHLWAIESKLRELNEILKRFKGYQKDLEPQYPDNFVSEIPKKKEEPQDSEQ